jgi:hypothetical protein
MQFSHLLNDVACAIVAQERLIQQAVFFVVIQLQPAPLFTAQDRSECLIDQSLRPNRQVFVIEVVMSDHVVSAFEKSYIQLDVFELEFFLRLQEMC